MSIRENLDFVARMYSVQNRREAVQRKPRTARARRSASEQLAGELSGGWKQRLALAACLIHDPKLLLLDEPTAGVDPKARRDFWEQIHGSPARGLTFLIATHYMDEAERCHRLAFILNGNLLARGTVAEVDRPDPSDHLVCHRPGFDRAGRATRRLPGVEQAVAFGDRSARERQSMPAALEAAIAPFRTDDYQWRHVEAGLEDVFISPNGDKPKRQVFVMKKRKNFPRRAFGRWWSRNSSRCAGTA